MSGKLAVILFNLGGPLKEKDIEPFLFSFFMDENIIRAPLPIRYFIAKWISWSRSRGAAKKSYGRLGGASPLLKNTQTQAGALETALREDIPSARVFVSMRHWHPFAKETVRDVIKFNPDKIILLPLYPQFSTATTKSSFQNWQSEVKKQNFSCPTFDICCYPENDGFISASAELVREELKKAPQRTKVLFSAHGLPEKIIQSGDPYQRQCEQTAAAIVKKLSVPGLDWELCYQSRVGRMKWIGPSTEEALKKTAAEGKGIIVYPLAFVSEHVETLVEIEIEYRETALRAGAPYFARVPTVGIHPAFIEGLKNMVLSRIKDGKG